LKNEPQIGRRLIKGTIILKFNFFEKGAPNRPKASNGGSMFLFNFVEKRAPNRPKANNGGFYIYNLILVKNDPKIGCRRIKEILCLFNFVENEPQSGRRPIKGDFLFFI
jgi:hypothetical protein